jgi:AraC-like DNA-binding protein
VALLRSSVQLTGVARVPVLLPSLPILLNRLRGAHAQTMMSRMSNAMDELRSIVMRADTRWTDIGIPRVSMVCAEACADQVYQPMLHFVLQGSKTLSIGDRVMNYEAGTYFLVPVDVPATGQIRPGGPGLPYLAISLALEPAVIASLLLDDVKGVEHASPVCFSGVPAPSEMTDAWLRMLRLIDRPHDIAMLAPMIEREILFRALQGPLGRFLCEIARPDGRLSHIRRAIHWIREHYTEPFLVEQLAAMTDMSMAAFYRHFKAITAMTPIQYQKRLRLLRARWLLLFEPRDAASIAFAVGYESASQFNREYARLFGLPPARDIARFKTPARQSTMAANDLRQVA